MSNTMYWPLYTRNVGTVIQSTDNSTLENIVKNEWDDEYHYLGPDINSDGDEYGNI